MTESLPASLPRLTPAAIDGTMTAIYHQEDTHAHKGTEELQEE